MMTVARELIGVLKEAGVEVVFGIPSIHNIALYEALRKDGSILHVLCRQEATAAHMADGYARAGQGPGVVISSSGPGTGYLVPSIQEAWGSCSPVVAITTNVPEAKIGKGLGLLHELECQQDLFRTITKTVIPLRSSNDIRFAAAKALKTAVSDRPGPVYMEVPVDLFERPLKGERTPSGHETGPTAPFEGINRAADMLNRALRPLIIAGLGAVRAGLGPEITALAEMLAAPVVTVAQAKGIIPEDHRLSFGNAARKGVVRSMADACDVVLAVGTRLRQVDAKRRGLSLRRLIHVDWDDSWVDRNFPSEIALTGDMPGIVRGLLDRLRALPQADRSGEWVRERKRECEAELKAARGSVEEIRYLDVIRKRIPRDGLLVADNTQLGYWAEYFYPSYVPGGFVSAKGSFVIGFSFPAAAGAKMALPGRTVVGLVGDGGFLYGAQELATCMRHNIGFPVIVVNDGAYGIIDFLQRKAYGEAYESSLVNPDFVALSKAYGAKAVRVDSPDGLDSALDRALSSGDMWVIELAASFPDPPYIKY